MARQSPMRGWARGRRYRTTPDMQHGLRRGGVILSLR